MPPCAHYGATWGCRGGSTEEQDRRSRWYALHVAHRALTPDMIVMTAHRGAVVFVEITGEVADELVVAGHYPDVGTADGSLVWAIWRKPTHDELVKAWPSRWPAGEVELRRGWWQPTLDELRVERRKARSIERSLATRHSKEQER